mgnify:CR=1 FL=1
MNEIKSILFLCTGNSCRSQMAEGLAKKLYPNVEVYSAGIETHGINPYATKVMSEIGIDISNHTSDLTTTYSDRSIDLVVTVCDNAKENCPYFLAKKMIHQSFDDPPALAKSLQDEEEVLKIYRKVRDQIKDFIQNVIISP